MARLAPGTALCSFIPSLTPAICAENEFGTPDFDERISHRLYKPRLAGCRTTYKPLFELLAGGACIEAACEIYLYYVIFSSIYRAACQTMDKHGEDAPLEGCVSTLCNFSDDFKLRQRKTNTGEAAQAAPSPRIWPNRPGTTPTAPPSRRACVGTK